MFSHHLKIAIRNFFKYKVYSLINLVGLTIGIVSVLFIFLFVQDEMSYDKYHLHSENIYRVAGKGHLNEGDFNFATCGAPTAQAMIADYPEVVDAVRFRDRGSFLVSIGDKHFKEERAIYVDSNLFEIFSFELISGDPATALTQPNSLILTPELASKYFGNENPIGKILQLDNNDDYKVTGVFAPIPANTHFHYDMFLSMSTLEDSRMPFWTNFNYQTYLLLAEGANAQALGAKLPGMVLKYIGPEIEQYLGATFEQFTEQGNQIGFYLQPLTDIHLHSDLEEEHEANSDIGYVYIFSIFSYSFMDERFDRMYDAERRFGSIFGIFAGLAIFVACLGLFGLAAFTAEQRTKEIGIRKILGATFWQIIGLLSKEFAVLISIGFVIGSLIAYFGMNYWLQNFEYKTAIGGWTFVIAAVTIFAIVALTVSYQSTRAARANPVDSLKYE